ncbi:MULTISPECIES: hypothetical protein [Aerococcus]|nr:MULTISPECIES: hypothetical protein [Aerococcus]MDK6368640.1 hypothetical protein [Aerococcus sp. UMB9870]MDK6679723.1 hypothetical protein [Aerococcus sp. UMB8608]MDK6686005.1 hypothetical protein [Aerococcus sp. UMB8623]MDK6940811.1 hypothetical protein [Aerococcus sp. UMB8487]
MKILLKSLGAFIAATATLFLFMYGLLTYSNHVYLERYKAGNDDYYL